MGRKAQQRRAAKAAKPSYGPGAVTETRLIMAARSFPDCGCGGTQDLDVCPNCDALYGEEGDANDGHWWRTCHECSDPELPDEDPNSEPLNWCAACGVTRRGFM